MTNEEKLEFVKEAFLNHIQAINSLPDMVTFINNLSKANAKTFLANNLSNRATGLRDTYADAQAKATEFDDLSEEVDAL